MKTMMGNCASTYQVLRTAAPTFLQMVFSNPELWLSSDDPTLVPLGPIIASTHHALAYFALTDSLSAMAFGLPSQVEYYTLGYTITSAPVPFEWTHSSPAEFQMILADINACRDKRPGARSREDLERQLLSWQAQPSYYDESWESWMINAWFAVQESWRLALLAYLYMVSSLSWHARVYRAEVVDFSRSTRGYLTTHRSNYVRSRFSKYLIW